MTKTVFLAALGSLVALAAADDCKATSKQFEPFVEKDETLCKNMGDGMWTFAMTTGMIDVPTPSTDAGQGLDGAVVSGSFMIADNNCNVKGVYGKPKCAAPYVIQESLLPMTLSILSSDFDVGAPYFKFAYGNGEYVVRNNQCGCKSASSGLKAEEHCGCAFPLNGTLPEGYNPSKRDVDEPTEESRQAFEKMVKRMVAKPFAA